MIDHSTKAQGFHRNLYAAFANHTGPSPTSCTQTKSFPYERFTGAHPQIYDISTYITKIVEAAE